MVVEDDCHLLVDVLAGYACPVAGALRVHAHGHFVAAEGVVVGRCVAYGLAVKGGVSAVCAEGVEGEAEVHFLAVGVGVDGGLYGPAELEVGGKDVFGVGGGEELVYGAHGLCVGGVAYGCAVAGVLENGDEGGGVVDGVGGEGADESAELTLDFGSLIGFVEFEVGATLEEVADAFVVLDAGKLKENLAVFALKDLNVGRNYAKLVDTVAEDVGSRVVDAVFHLSLEACLDGVVIAAGGDDALKEDGEVGLRLGSAVGVDEGADEVVALVGFNGCVCAGEGRFENGVGCAALHAANHVGHVDLKDYVHASLEVEAEAEAPFAYVVEGVVAQVHFFFAERVHVVLVGLIVGCVIVVAAFREGVCRGVALVLVGDECEREVEETYNHKAYGNNTGDDAT